MTTDAVEPGDWVPGRCPEPCGKFRLSKEQAKSTARRLRDQRDDSNRRFLAYAHDGAWHVGHTDGWRARRARRDRIRRQERLDRLDKEV